MLRCVLRPRRGDDAVAGVVEGRRSLPGAGPCLRTGAIPVTVRWKRYGVETTYYTPEIDEAGIKALMRPNTTIVYTESPGSHTFEVQDIPAIARAAHAGGAKVLMDNTWGIHHFQPFKHGVDVSDPGRRRNIRRDHSDILIGTVTVNNDADWMTLYATARGIGQCYASPDDCWMTLRGMRTMAVRLRTQMEAAIHVGHWLRQQPGGLSGAALPALPGALPVMRSGSATLPAHAACSGSSSSRSSRQSARTDSSKRWSCSASVRHGAVSKVSRIRPREPSRARQDRANSAGPAVRLHIGLEDVDDLTADFHVRDWIRCGKASDFLNREEQ